MDKAERKEREFNLRRAEILEQAEKIFAAKGFHNTTVAEIAGASGFAVVTDDVVRFTGGWTKPGRNDQTRNGSSPSAFSAAPLTRAHISRPRSVLSVPAPEM